MDVVIASSAADAAAVEAVKQHHAQLAGALSALVEATLDAVGRIGGAGESAVGAARDALVHFCDEELMPHATAEEQSMYPAGARFDTGALLVEAMIAEHHVIGALVEAIRTGQSPVAVAANAVALRVLFESHLAKENDIILPLLAAEPSVSVAALLEGMHELLGADGHGEAQPAAATGGCGGGGQCGCGGASADASPELDLRAVPHAVRHATAFGAVGAIPVGQSLVLVAPHDPLPLLGQIEAREPHAFEVTYVERGPEAWRVRLSRV